METEKINEIIEKVKSTVSEYIKKADDKLNEYFSPNGKKMFLCLVAFAILAIVLTSVTTFSQINNETASPNAYKVLDIIIMSFLGIGLLLELSGLIPFCIESYKVNFSTFRTNVLRRRVITYYCIDAGLAITSIVLTAILLSMGKTVTGSDQTKFLIIMGCVVIITIVCIIFKAIIMRNMGKSTRYVRKGGVYEDAQVEE